MQISFSSLSCISKTTVSSANTSQASGNPSQQITIFFASLRPSWKASVGDEHAKAPFLDVEKAFNNVWHNGLRYKIYQLDLPTKLCRWLSDFLVGRVIQVKIEGFLSPKVYPKAGVPQGSNLSPLPFLIYVNDMPNPTHHQTNKSQFADDAGQWAVSKNIDLAVICRGTLTNWQGGVPNGE